MIGNSWVGQENGKDSPRRVRISPLLFSQHQLRNILYLPKLRDLPLTGLDLKAIVFDFGFDPGTNSLAPFGTGLINVQIERPLLMWGMTAFTNDQSNPAVGFNFQLYHARGSNQRFLFNKDLNNANVAGAGTNPLLLRSPYLLMRGDQLTCEVKNLSNNQANPGGANASAQVVVWGGEFD